MAKRGPKPFWTRERVLNRLRALQRQGESLSPGHVVAKNPSVYLNARKHFGSYDDALLALGIDPASVRIKRTWDRQKVLSTLRAHADSGAPLTATSVCGKCPGLYVAATKLFGSFRDALLALGVDPASIRTKQPWNRERVVRDLRARRDSGKPLNAIALNEESPGLYACARKVFGSYKAALRAAGIDAEAVRKRKWHPESVKVELRRIASEERFPTRRALWRAHPVCYTAAQKFFGSYDAALRAAGIERDPVDRLAPWPESSAATHVRGGAGRQPWTCQSVAAALQELIARGADLSFTAVKRRDPQLARAAERYFGNYFTALRYARRGLSMPPIIARAHRVPGRKGKSQSRNQS